MKSNYDDDVNYQKLAHAVTVISDEQAKLVLEAVIASFEGKAMGKPVQFDSHMIYILSAIIGGYKPAGWHWSL